MIIKRGDAEFIGVIEDHELDDAKTREILEKTTNKSELKTTQEDKNATN